jgi:hypothetical protein
MRQTNSPNDRFIAFPGGSSCYLSMIGGVRLIQGDRVWVADRGNTNPVAVLEPGDFPDDLARDPERIVREINRMIATFNSGRRVELPAWATIDLD